MPPFTLANLAAYSAQVLLIAGAAGVLLAILRVDAPALRYVLLRVTLMACLALPWLQTPQAHRPIAPSPAVTLEVVEQPAAAGPAAPPLTIDWTAAIALVLASGIALRLLWLAVGLARLSRLRRAGVRADATEHAEFQQAMGTSADVRYVADFAQPVTFGIRRPVVVLPESLRGQPQSIRDAVLAHELLHVQRRDWAWVLAEETARALFWFHPAMWWLISRVQLAREEVVDALAVARTGCRRAYIEALMAFADEAPLAPAPAFARKRHLFRRMVLISREDSMTGKRLVISAAAIVTLMLAGGWYAVSAFPLAEHSAQILQKTAGPLEASANPVTPENPIPRRLQHQSPEMPTSLVADNAFVTLTFRLTLDATGAVAEARITEARLRLSDGTVNVEDERAKPYYDAAVAAAVSAIERWRYEQPANPPVSFDMTFFFAKEVTEAPAALARAFTRLDDTKTLRVGGNVRVPTKVRDARPFYPPDAMDAKVQGVVVMDIRIDEQGRVSDAAILRSIPMLDQAALDAVKQWEFTPTLLNGAPIPVIATVTINFTLK
jgi:protein TonB